MRSKRFFALLICIFTLMTVVPFVPTAYAADDGTTTLIAASDFQPKDGSAKGIKVVEDILKSIGKSGVTKADGFLFCGDYDFGTFGNSEETKEGISALTESLQGIVDEKNMVFVQGNHDATLSAKTSLSPSGNNDRADGAYGVYVIHNDDYMWANKDEQRIKLTAQKLINYHGCE